MPQHRNTKKRNKRNIIWFTPPYNKSLKTKVGKIFLGLVRKHFPPESKLYPILNKNTLKISYSCTPNMKQIIQMHNKKILNAKGNNTHMNKGCSCQKKEQCPLNNNCKETNVIYRATTPGPNPRKYVGSTENFKRRYYTHQQSFKNENLKHSTTLSNYIWEKNLNPQPNLHWEIIASAPTYKKGGRSCQLCLTEKAIILANSKDPVYLNRRSEIAQKCRHRASHMLSRIKHEDTG